MYIINIYLEGEKTTSYPEMTIPKDLWVYDESIFKNLSYSSKIRTYLWYLQLLLIHFSISGYFPYFLLKFST